ncbi:MAG: Fatty acid hydroxylase-like protein [Acidimicrobiales bacterium]|nr:Fatty acid hydroxylase-like protein [Acidimicrobiales bacterium]
MVLALVVIASAFALGVLLWSLVEYLLHRFAMHQLKGRGIMSREHLEHHVQASWGLSPIDVLSWAGLLVVGLAGWLPLGWWMAGRAAGIAFTAGWTAGYAAYEYLHASAHLHAPSGAYSGWLRRHHLHHHFGHPMVNHGVTTPLWDRLFGTLEAPTTVRIPRRLAPAWLLDPHGDVRPELRATYEVVGLDVVDERMRALDRARALASLAPPD